MHTAAGYAAGLAVTARHCVVWEDGCIHPLRLCILGCDDIKVRVLGLGLGRALTTLTIAITALELSGHGASLPLMQCRI